LSDGSSALSGGPGVELVASLQSTSGSPLALLATLMSVAIESVDQAGAEPNQPKSPVEDEELAPAAEEVDAPSPPPQAGEVTTPLANFLSGLADSLEDAWAGARAAPATNPPPAPHPTPAEEPPSASGGAPDSEPDRPATAATVPTRRTLDTNGPRLPSDQPAIPRGPRPVGAPLALASALASAVAVALTLADPRPARPRDHAIDGRIDRDR
jgi:hypothetical protein